MSSVKDVLWQEITHHLGLGFELGNKISRLQGGNASIEDLQKISLAVHKVTENICIGCGKLRGKKEGFACDECLKELIKNK